MSIVQSIPNGYLALLGIKQGTNPGQSADFVTPVLELGNLYTANALISNSSTTAGVTNVGDQAVLTIPATEAWRILAVSYVAHTPSGAIASLDVELVLVDPSVGHSVVFSAFGPAALAAGDQVGRGVLYPQQVVFPPGTQLAAKLFTDLGALTFSLVLAVSYQKLTV